MQRTRRISVIDRMNFSCGKSMLPLALECTLTKFRDDIHLGLRAHEKLAQAVVQYLL